MGRLAIIAGRGSLPRRIAENDRRALFVHFEGVSAEFPGNPSMRASIERFGTLLAALHAEAVTRVVFAGGLSRPTLDPAKFDAGMQLAAPGFLAAMAGGDDGLLRAVIGAFEADGFSVVGAHQVLPGLTAAAGLLAGPDPLARDLQDAARARAIHAALGPLDVGQGVVVADGQCLGVETAQGTDAILGFVAAPPPALRRRARGVLVKAPKPGQDLRVDMPAIGPGTIAAAAAAGLAGIVIDAGTVLVLERAAVIDAAASAGIFVLAQSP